MLRNGQSVVHRVNFGVIGRGYAPWGECNFHTNIQYACRNGRLYVQNVYQCQQARTGPTGATCRLAGAGTGPGIRPDRPGRPGHGAREQRYNHPRMAGHIVDWCQTWASNCGWGGAHQFCRQQGYRQATNWATYRPGSTYVVGSRRVCRGGNCTGFRHVTCTR